MKKELLYFAAVICAACTVACSENPVDDSAQPSVPEPAMTALRIETARPDASGAEVSSRAEYADGLGLRWQAADATKMAVYYRTAAGWTTTATKSIDISEDLHATFEADVAVGASEAYFYYPYSGVDDGTTTHTFAFPATVTQQTAGASDNFALAASKSVLDPDAMLATPRFRMVGAAVRFIIYSGGGMAESVKSVKLTASVPISAEKYLYDLEQGTATLNGVQSNTVTVSLVEPYALSGVISSEDAKGIYMPILPASTEGYTYTVVTDKNTYEFVSAKSRSWERGTLSDVFLNLDKATSKGENHTLAFDWSSCQASMRFTAPGEQRSGWFLAYLDGASTWVPESTAEIYGQMKFVCSEDWVTAVVRDNNNLFVSCTSSAPIGRTATVEVYFDGDTNKYLVDGVAKPLFTISVSQIPDDKYLAFHFGGQDQPNTTSYAATAGTSDRELPWASIYALTQGAWTRFEDNSGVYSTNYITFYSDVDWLDGSTPNVNKLHCLVTKSNETGEDRIGHLYGRMASPAGYEDYTADDPFFTVTVTQSGVHTLVPNWGDNWGGWSGRFVTREASASEANDVTINWVSYRVDGGNPLDGASAEYKWVRFESDSEWLSGNNVNNTYRYSCLANSTGAERTGVLKVYMNIPSDVKSRYSIAKNASDADYDDPMRVFTITVIQKAQ